MVNLVNGISICQTFFKLGVHPKPAFVHTLFTEIFFAKSMYVCLSTSYTCLSICTHMSKNLKYTGFQVCMLSYSNRHMCMAHKLLNDIPLLASVNQILFPYVCAGLNRTTDLKTSVQSFSGWLLRMTTNYCK